jgi:tetratricopeptide (TPR) repeat protein
MKAASGSRNRLLWLLLLAGLLVANSAYLAADGNPHPFYFANLLLHLGLGLLLIAPFLSWWWRRRRRRAVLTAGLLLLAGAGSGLALAWLGNLTHLRGLLWTHIGLSAGGLVLLLAAQAGHRSRPLWRLSAAGLALALAAPALVGTLGSGQGEQTISNPPAPSRMADEAMGGEDGPFFPSSVHTNDGGTVPSSVYLNSESCARANCHPDLYDQWQGSAHHFSSFNNQWYRKSIEYMQEVVGVQPSKWCGGCHDPAILQSGLMDTPIEEIVHTEEAQAGLGCTACHMITDVGSTMGQGDYEITVPPLHDLAASDNRWLNMAHDFLVRLDPEPHRRTFIQPFFSQPEYCSACHKVHLDAPVNDYRWLRGFNEYDNWQASGVSGQGARSFYYPAQPMSCIDCHMPLVPSDDAANENGLTRSHRFPGANTALPTANRDERQLEEVTRFLQASQVTVDIFAMTEADPVVGGIGPQLEGPALATSFAIGEEQGMAVGRGAAQSGPAETLFAPLDSVPATVRRGESTRIDVVVRTRGVGHFFPGGTVDAYDCWLELKAEDSAGRVVFWSGMADEQSPVEPGAHFYRARMIDAHGNPIDKRNAFATRAAVYVRLIPPGAADTVHFRLAVPPDTGDRLTLTARLNYRKFSWFNTHWAYAGVPDPSQEGAEFGPGFDDRRFLFTGDTSRVSGQIKEIPTLPIVVMAEDRVELQVVEDDQELPEMGLAGEGPRDRERWNDYGIGLLRQGDLRGAERAFERVTALEPGYVDGWVNLGRVALAEGDLDRAGEVLAKALEIEPDLARAHHFLGVAAKELGEYDTALEHLEVAVRQYPRDRVVLNQIGVVHFRNRDYPAAVAALEKVLAIDPEDLMAHYTLMLSYRGLGELERSRDHQALYKRFKADEASQILTGEYRKSHPHDNNERQPIHEHVSVPAEEIAAGAPTGVAAGG